MVGRRDRGHRGQGGVRHGSILRDIHKNLCMGHRDHPLLAGGVPSRLHACRQLARDLAGLAGIVPWLPMPKRKAVSTNLGHGTAGVDAKRGGSHNVSNCDLAMLGAEESIGRHPQPPMLSERSTGEGSSSASASTNMSFDIGSGIVTGSLADPVSLVGCQVNVPWKNAEWNGLYQFLVDAYVDGAGYVISWVSNRATHYLKSKEDAHVARSTASWRRCVPQV